MVCLYLSSPSGEHVDWKLRENHIRTFGGMFISGWKIKGYVTGNDNRFSEVFLGIFYKREILKERSLKNLGITLKSCWEHDVLEFLLLNNFGDPNGPKFQIFGKISLILYYIF